MDRSREPEHSNLRLDVAPVPRRFVVMRELSVQAVAHADDAIGHSFDLSFPKRPLRISMAISDVI